MAIYQSNAPPRSGTRPPGRRPRDSRPRRSAGGRSSRAAPSSRRRRSQHWPNPKVELNVDSVPVLWKPPCKFNPKYKPHTPYAKLKITPYTIKIQTLNLNLTLSKPGQRKRPIDDFWNVLEGTSARSAEKLFEIFGARRAFKRVDSMAAVNMFLFSYFEINFKNENTFVKTIESTINTTLYSYRARPQITINLRDVYDVSWSLYKRM